MIRCVDLRRFRIAVRHVRLRIYTTARDDAYLRLVTQRHKPRNEVEQIAQKLAGSLGRMTDYDARKAWVGIWAQAVAQASENDLGRLAG